MNTTPPQGSFSQPRAHPRLKYATPLAITFSGRLRMGTTEDIAIGGLGARCDVPPAAGAKIGLLFNLPMGASVRTDGAVRYVVSSRFGVQFTGLPEEAREGLEQYTKEMLGQLRRGGRVTKRFHVTLRSMASDSAPEQLGETVVLSPNGGRLVCRARFGIGEELRLYWPHRHREAQIRVVFRQLCGTGDLTDIGFEFLTERDFWGHELK